MAGHSKWKQIKHKKGISDVKRSAVFSKLSKLIAIAARDNQDPITNIRLQGIIERARAANMPKDNIERAINRAKEKDAQMLKEITIHATGLNGSVFIIRAVTDNSNRTIQELKKIFTKYDVKMAADGSLDWMFQTLSFTVCTTPSNFESSPMLEEVISMGVSDIEQNENNQTILYHSAQQAQGLRKILGEQKVDIIMQEVQIIPKSPLIIQKAEDLQRIEFFIEEVEDLSDVDTVITNIQNPT